VPAERALGLGEASRAIAAIALRRALRRRAVWIALGFALLPAAYAAVTVDGSPGHGAWRDVFTFGLSLLAIVPTMLVAGAIGEDLDDRTAAYLWSRPLPRAALVTGKLLAMAPLAFAVIAAGMTAAFAVAWGDDVLMLGRGLLALGLGVAVVSAAAAALATLAPRVATALAVVYVLFIDIPLGVVPLAMQQLSITYQVSQVAGVDQYPAPLAGGLLALAGLGAVWTAIALWRVRRVE